jgi:hypothetical protein
MVRFQNVEEVQEAVFHTGSIGKGQSSVLKLLVSYDLINTVSSPTRITSSSESLIDVIVTNREYLEQRAMVIDLGLSNHLAQIIRIPSEKELIQLK